MPYKNTKIQNEYQNKWLKKRRLSWILENGPCKLCGSNRKLVVDHKDPKTKVTHRIWSWKESKRKKELRKCRVICLKCHKRKTFKNKEYSRGEKSGNHKLTNKKVKKIREMYSKGKKVVDIAKMLKVNNYTTYDVVWGRTWKHIKI